MPNIKFYSTVMEWFWMDPCLPPLRHSSNSVFNMVELIKQEQYLHSQYNGLFDIFQ